MREADQTTGFIVRKNQGMRVFVRHGGENERTGMGGGRNDTVPATTIDGGDGGGGDTGPADATAAAVCELRSARPWNRWRFSQLSHRVSNGCVRADAYAETIEWRLDAVGIRHWREDETTAKDFPGRREVKVEVEVLWQ